MIDTGGAHENIPVRMRKNRTFQDFINGITLTAIGALVVVVIMLYITSISFSTEFSINQIGLEGIVLYLATVSISVLSRSYARRKGRDTKQYKAAHGRVEENNASIISNGYSARTAEYCRKWEETELYSERLKALSVIGISVEDFVTKYVRYNKRELAEKYPDLSAGEVKVILAAQKIKRLKYDESYLTVADKPHGRHAPSGGFNSHTIDALKVAQVFITAAVSSLFSASLVLEVVANPSWETIVTCAIKLITIIVFGVFGMVGGYNLSAVREAGELSEKADEQARFIKWCDSQTKEKATENSVALSVIDDLQTQN